MLTGPRQHVAHSAAQPDQIPHGFVGLIGHPDRRQFTGPMKACQQGGVATVSLDTVTRFGGDQGGRHHRAAMAETGQVAMKTIATRASLVAERQGGAGSRELSAEFADGRRIIGNLAEVFDGAAAPALGHRDGNLILVDIQAYKSGMLHQARLLCMRLCAGCAGLTLVPLHIG